MHRLEIRSFLLTVFLGLSLLSSSASAQETQTVHVMVPYIKQLIDKTLNKDWSGPLLSVFDKIEHQTGLKLSFTVLPFPRVVDLTQKGKADLAIYIDSPKRSKLAVPLFKLSHSSLVLSGLKARKIHKLDDLKGLKIGMPRQSFAAYLEQMFPHSQFLYFNSHNDLITALLAGKVDAFITPDFRFIEMIQHSGKSYSDFSKPLVLATSHLTLFASHKFAENTEIINKLKHLKNVEVQDFGQKALFKHYQ